MEKIFTIDTASKRLGISYPRMYRLVIKKKIKAYKPGTTEWLIKEKDLEAYEKSSDRQVT